MARYKYFHEMYDPFTSNGFEKYFSDNEEIRYRRFYEKYSVFQSFQVDKTRKTMFDIAGLNFLIIVHPDESGIGGGFNIQKTFHNENELYKVYEEANKDILELFKYWDNNWHEKSINALLNKRIYENYSIIYNRMYKNVVFSNIKEVRKEINKLHNNSKYSFESFIEISSSLYICYLIMKYDGKLFYDVETGALRFISDIKKRLFPSNVVASFWYFGDGDYLERGQACWDYGPDWDELREIKKNNNEKQRWGPWLNRLKYIYTDDTKRFFPCIIDSRGRIIWVYSFLEL